MGIRSGKIVRAPRCCASVIIKTLELARAVVGVPQRCVAAISIVADNKE
jgi:hypothetical protein